MHLLNPNNHKAVDGKKTTILHEKYSKIEPNPSFNSRDWDNISKKIVLIGTSTGGPNALQKVLTKLPKDIPAPIVIVQHMPPGFTKTLADRLNSLSKIIVKEAEDREILQNGTAYIAPGGYHLRISPYGQSIMVKLELTKNNIIPSPSMDIMLCSAADLIEIGKIVVIMTGMGSDGVKGLKVLKCNGQVKAIAEAEETCVVFGMPKAAIATNLVDDIEKVEDIATNILKYLLVRKV